MTLKLFCLLAIGAICEFNCSYCSLCTSQFLSVYANPAEAQSSPAPIPYVDRKCGDDLSNLWLDVVAVVDNSKGMRNDGLTDVRKHSETVK